MLLLRYKHAALERVPALKVFVSNPKYLDQSTNSIEVRNYLPHQKIYQEGQLTGAQSGMFFLLRGEVEVRGHGNETAVMTDRSFFGEHELVNPLPTRAEAEADVLHGTHAPMGGQLSVYTSTAEIISPFGAEILVFGNDVMATLLADDAARTAVKECQNNAGGTEDRGIYILYATETGTGAQFTYIVLTRWVVDMKQPECIVTSRSQEMISLVSPIFTLLCIHHGFA